MTNNNIVISGGSNIRVEGTLTDYMTRFDSALVQCEVGDVVNAAVQIYRDNTIYTLLGYDEVYNYIEIFKI